jgi:hypothetical protein
MSTCANRIPICRQLVISAHMKATQARHSVFALRKKARRVSAPQWVRRRLRYDARSFRIEKDKGVVATVAGWMKLPCTSSSPEVARRWFHHRRLAATPVRWVHLVVDIKPPEFVSCGRVGGIDLGINLR